MNKVNYQKELDNLIASLTKEGQVPSLLLHSCCAPCSSYCIEYLSQFFNVTVFYYNPNIYPDEEYYHRVKEQQRFISQFPTKHPVKFIEGDYDKDSFYAIAKGLEKEPEKGIRCHKCYDLRLRKTATVAKDLGFDYFRIGNISLPVVNICDLYILYAILEDSWQPKRRYKRQLIENYIKDNLNPAPFRLSKDVQFPEWIWNNINMLMKP